MAERTLIGELLLAAGHIDETQLQIALAYQRTMGGRLGRAMVQLGYVEERVVIATVAGQLGIPCVSLGERLLRPELIPLLPVKLMQSRCVIPVARASAGARGVLYVATAEPGNLEVLDEVAFATGMIVRPVLASEGDLARALQRLVADVRRPATRRVA